MTRSLILSILASLAATSAASAQLARSRTPQQDAPRLLVAPFDRDGRDSTLSLLVADGLRGRLLSHHLDRFNTLSREAVNSTLRDANYAVDVPLGTSEIRQLASHLNARYVIEGNITRRGGDSVLVVARLVERVGNNPQSVNIAIVERASRIASSLGVELANRLTLGFRSFADVEECRRQLEQRNYDRALRKAADALLDYAASAAAHLCIADVMQALGASVDSVNAALTRAHMADTLNVVAMRRLAARYEAAADTVSLVAMLERLLAADTRDVDLRVRTVQLLVRRGQLPDAIRLINEGLATHPGSADLLTLRMIAFGATQVWDSAAATGETIAGMDSARVDSLFVWRVTNYYREASDTTGWLRWLDIAGRRHPTQLGRAYAVRASVQSIHGQVDSSLANARLALAADSSFGPSLAPVWLRAGQRAFADSAWVQAAEHFGQARAIAAGRTAVTAAYYQGVGLFQHGRRVDAEAEAGRSCELVRQVTTIWEEAERSIIAGAAQDRDVANQILQAIAQYRERAAGLSRAYCR